MFSTSYSSFSLFSSLGTILLIVFVGMVAMYVQIPFRACGCTIVACAGSPKTWLNEGLNAYDALVTTPIASLFVLLRSIVHPQKRERERERERERRAAGA